MVLAPWIRIEENPKCQPFSPMRIRGERILSLKPRTARTARAVHGTMTGISTFSDNRPRWSLAKPNESR